MLNRLIIVLIFVPILFLIFTKGNYTLLAFTEVVVLFSLYEFYNIIKNRGIKLYSLLGLIIASIIPIFAFYRPLTPHTITLLLTSFLIISVFQILLGNIIYDMEKLAYTFIGIIYIPLLFSYILHFPILPNGNILILFVFSRIWMCDSSAYLLGVKVGRHKFTNISPKKSIEGLIGGFIGVYLTVNYFSDVYYYLSIVLSKIKFLNFNIVHLSIFKKYSLETLVLSIIITIVAVLGDLFESKIKREFNVKDSSNILLGHGGFLDRFDSALFTIPVVYLYLHAIYFS